MRNLCGKLCFVSLVALFILLTFSLKVSAESGYKQTSYDSKEKEEISSMCYACHITGREVIHDWNISDHRKAGVNCIDCHVEHEIGSKPDKLKKIEITNLCLNCHQDRRAKMNMPSHHPLRERVMSCKDCHDPHSSNRVSLLDEKERCFRCHQDLRGPFTWEHGAVLEGCTVCHDPHGTIAPKLLVTNQPFLCLNCHSVADTRHDVSVSQYTQCTWCHAAIHGSNSGDEHLRR